MTGLNCVAAAAAARPNRARALRAAQYVEINKENDRDFFEISCNDNGTRWTGKAWFVYKLLRYEFDLQFEIPVTYPATCPEIELPELDGKTAKMFRGGKICLEGHFKQLWGRNTPKFGVAHALAMGLGPWLAAEVPNLVDTVSPICMCRCCLTLFARAATTASVRAGDDRSRGLRLGVRPIMNGGYPVNPTISAKWFNGQIFATFATHVQPSGS